MSITAYILGGAAALTAVGLTAAGLKENRTLSVTSYDVTLPHLSAAFDGYRLVQLSDLHATAFGSDQEHLVETVLSLSPQAVLITGDLIDRRRTHTERQMQPALTLLTRLSAAVRTLRVDGNHEPMSRVGERFRTLANATDAIDVTGRTAVLTSGGDKLTVVGVPDPVTVQKDLDRWSRRMHELCDPLKGSPRIVLSHRPHLLSHYRTLGEALVLCGHAHGGQWRVPLVGGLFAPDQGILPRHTEGLHRLDDTQILIHRGLGNSGFPFRLGNPPEVVAITLHAPKA